MGRRSIRRTTERVSAIRRMRRSSEPSNDSWSSVATRRDRHNVILSAIGSRSVRHRASNARTPLSHARSHESSAPRQSREPNARSRHRNRAVSRGASSGRFRSRSDLNLAPNERHNRERNRDRMAAREAREEGIERAITRGSIEAAVASAEPRIDDSQQNAPDFRGVFSLTRSKGPPSCPSPADRGKGRLPRQSRFLQCLKLCFKFRA